MRIDRLNFGPPCRFPWCSSACSAQTATACAPWRIRSGKPCAPTSTRATCKFDWNEQKKSVPPEVDQDRARSLGLTPQDIAQTLGTLLSGYTVTEYKEGIELVPVVARAIPEEWLGLASFEDLTIPTRSGAAIPISQVDGFITSSRIPSAATGSASGATVRSDRAPGVQAPDVTAAIQPAIDNIATTLPPGMRIEVGGAVEESAKANVALFKIFPLMFLAMLTILMLQLQRFSTLFLVFSTAPLGLVGAKLSPLAFHAPFGLQRAFGPHRTRRHDHAQHRHPVDQIDADVASGLSRWDAIIEFTVRRSRPLVLTAMAAILATDSIVALGVLGADGDHNDGRSSGRDDSDAAVPAGALCGVVPGSPAEGASDNPVVASAGTIGI